MKAIYVVPNHPCTPAWGVMLQQLHVGNLDYGATACSICGARFPIMASHPYKQYCSKSCGQAYSYKLKKELRDETPLPQPPSLVALPLGQGRSEYPLQRRRYRSGRVQGKARPVRQFNGVPHTAD